ncbi:hypothetical protein P154DRAFT_237627 [Amniculicola lignicola CBS 123094]|uniref:Uncharacterized protein n=1 Tax=Amniculicola lignicola CBS 123094 TaxID=1392246 RepID=A0A6A5WN20_9PLEO|nr:hypothetical protein P154DRAFT_237627 [Amniculicola lignicola CBS 123094]
MRVSGLPLCRWPLPLCSWFLLCILQAVPSLSCAALPFPSAIVPSSPPPSLPLRRSLLPISLRTSDAIAIARSLSATWLFPPGDPSMRTATRPATAPPHLYTLPPPIQPYILLIIPSALPSSTSSTARCMSKDGLFSLSPLPPPPTNQGARGQASRQIAGPPVGRARVVQSLFEPHLTSHAYIVVDMALSGAAQVCPQQRQR